MSVISLAGHEVRSQEEGWASLSPPCSVLLLPKYGEVLATCHDTCTRQTLHVFSRTKTSGLGLEGTFIRVVLCIDLPTLSKQPASDKNRKFGFC